MPLLAVLWSLQIQTSALLAVMGAPLTPSVPTHQAPIRVPVHPAMWATAWLTVSQQVLCVQSWRQCFACCSKLLFALNGFTETLLSLLVALPFENHIYCLSFTSTAISLAKIYILYLLTSSDILWRTRIIQYVHGILYALLQKSNHFLIFCSAHTKR